MKQSHSIVTGIVLYALAVVAVALIGYLTVGLKEKSTVIQGQVEVDEYRVSFKLPGRVKRILVREGDCVKAGDSLVILDAPDVEAKQLQAESLERAAAAMADMTARGAREEQVRAAYAVWQQAKAAKDIAQKSYDRLSRLYAAGVVSAQKRDEAQALLEANSAQEAAAKSQYDMAKNGARAEERSMAVAKRSQAQGAVAEVNAYIDEMVQCAETDGEVTDIYPKVGELVGAGSPIMTIAIMRDAWGTFNVREDRLASLAVGSPISVYVPALDRTISMTIYAMKDQGTYAVWKATKEKGEYDLKTFEIKARPTEPVEGLRPGMSLIYQP